MANGTNGNGNGGSNAGGAPGDEHPGATPQGQATGPQIAGVDPEQTHQMDEGGQAIREPVIPQSAAAVAQPYHQSAIEAQRGGQEWQMPSAEQLAQEAEQRERERARSRGVSEEEIETLNENTVWMVSNRLDNRTVPGSFERDPRHPGGECSGIAGSTPARVYLTPTMERLKLDGSIVQLPEGHEPVAYVEVDDGQGGKKQVRNRKLPVEVEGDLLVLTSAQPGHPTPIGRELDKDLFSEDTRRAVKRQQRGMPAAIPVAPGGTTPTLQEVDRPS